MQQSETRETFFKLRQMQISDIGSAMKLSTAEGWNQTEKDWQLFIENRENACLVAESDKKVIATTTAINYSNRIAWIAMVLVDKEYRGRGVSKMLLEAILDKLQHCESIKLDATPAGRQVYRKFGFLDEYRLMRMTNIMMQALPLEEHQASLPQSIQPSDITAVVAFDEIIFGANRSALIPSLVREYPGKASMLKENNEITGIALGRSGNRYHHIGPVLTSNTFDARVLISEALKSLIGQAIVVDVMVDKQELVEWLRSIGFINQREFIRMYRGHNAFPGMIENQFLICGPEFG
ncbi:MAG TPA: GNAT family N-acetyltransferase [Flavitalea sp.]|nr:GNAT family N-acetyltransferase [Flavitalea sp.]